MVTNCGVGVRGIGLFGGLRNWGGGGGGGGVSVLITRGSYYLGLYWGSLILVNPHLRTIKFFFNEHSQQFPLYTEAIRFFGHQDAKVSKPEPR